MNRKHIKIGIIILSAAVLVCVALIGTVVYIHSKQLVIEFYENTEINVNETADNYQFVKTLKNGEILTEKTEIDTKSVGEKRVVLTVKSTFGSEKEFTFIVLVVDRECPRIIFNNLLETTAGEEIDLLQGVSATDNSNEEITVTVEGDYDFKTAGEHSLKYIACDSSMNKTEEKFTLKVKEKVVAVVAPAPQVQKDPPKPTSEPVYFTTSKGFQGMTIDGVTYIDGYLIANKTYSLPASYGNGLTGETQSAFNAMTAAAKADGVSLSIKSGFRNYSYQQSLYNGYVSRDGAAAADTYSAGAGHSEHQSGLAVDLNTMSTSAHFENSSEYAWLQNNCYKYGFILRYPEGKTNETGYIYEPWHYRYVGVELAAILYNGGDWITMEDYFGITSQYQ